MIRFTKTAENSFDYSLHNTVPAGDVPADVARREVQGEGRDRHVRVPDRGCPRRLGVVYVLVHLGSGCARDSRSSISSSRSRGSRWLLAPAGCTTSSPKDGHEGLSGRARVRPTNARLGHRPVTRRARVHRFHRGGVLMLDGPSTASRREIHDSRVTAAEQTAVPRFRLLAGMYAIATAAVMVILRLEQAGLVRLPRADASRLRRARGAARGLAVVDRGDAVEAVGQARARDRGRRISSSARSASPGSSRDRRSAAARPAR